MDSIQEQIIKKVAAALAQITVANGYQNTIASVQRFMASGINLNTLPTILVKEGDCAKEPGQSKYLSVRRRMELYLVVAVKHDETADPRSGGEILNSFTADIEKRLAGSSNWDGLAILTEPPDYLDMDVDAETPHLARGLRTEIVYEHLRTDPRAQ